MKIVWSTEKRKVKDLIPAEYNPRKLSDKSREDLTNSIREFSEVEPVVINLDNHLIGGHQRCTIYADLGIEEIDVRVPNRQLTTEEEVKLNIRLNKNVGEWDDKKLSEFSPDLLKNVGFNNTEISNMFDIIEVSNDEFDEKKAKEEAKKTSIIKGDIYKLGNHRLMCGDSRSSEDVKKMMNDEKADCIYSDPPYNIKLNYSSGFSNKEKYQGKYDDDKTDVDYRVFLYETISNALENALENAQFFYWCDERYIGMIQSIYNDLMITNRRVCMWIKNNQNPTPQVAFNKVYEPCVYGTKGNPYLNGNYKAFHEVLNKEIGNGNQMHDDLLDLFNIWAVSRETTTDYEHPTQKPVTLHEKPLKRCTAPGNIVLDLFGGSGSTLMACEQLNRKARLVEIDPIFCQVIINRWEKLTGEKAIKL